MTEAATETKPHPENAPNPSAIPPDELARLTDDIVAALKTVYDPEIPVDIYELGLIYKVDLDDDRNLAIDMTLTAPGAPGGAACWGGGSSPFSPGPAAATARPPPPSPPPWDHSRMSDEARVALNMW